MFTWIPFYEELAGILLNFRYRQSELIELLLDIKQIGLPVIKLDDIGSAGEIPLAELDPFTFYATFNRGIRNDHRIGILTEIKKRLEVKADIPSDFHGLPVVDLRLSWFFPYKKDRTEGDIEALWELAELAVLKGVESLKEDVFARCLKIRAVGLPKLTVGLFWLRPNLFMPFDRRSKEFFKVGGLDINVTDLISYKLYLQEIHKKFQEDFSYLSYQAYIDSSTPHEYWQIAPGEKARLWEDLKSNSIAAVGWNELDFDLTGKSKDELFALIRHKYPNDSEMAARISTTMLWNFLNLKPGNKFVTNKGKSLLLGLGVIKGGYKFRPERNEYRHTVDVDYYAVPEAGIEIPEDFKGKFGKTIIPLDSKVFEKIEALFPAPGIIENYTLPKCASDTGLAVETLSSWVKAIERKGQAIIYGPPGTGKTFIAERLAKHLVSGANGFQELIQFHPSYGYEDFLQGLRPKAREGGGLDYPMVPGRFFEFCKKAGEKSGKCVLIIDEINRANLSRVFGELMYLLEYRDQEVPLAGGGSLKIPKNVRIIGTMNTADRSIALVDYALRRRFAFLALYPNYDIFEQYHQNKETGFPSSKLVSILRQLNQDIGDPHYEIGISFFLRVDLEEQVEDIWRMEIEPYLEEYFFDQPDRAGEWKWQKIQSKLW
jgi:hypothetical protein